MSSYDGWVWWLFVFMTIIMVVTMLNFLISIINKTYGQVTSNKNQFMYSERVRLICDVQFVGLYHRYIERGITSVKRLLTRIFCSCKSCPLSNYDHKMFVEKSGVNSCSLLFFAWEDPTVSAPEIFDAARS